ncbi:hypothetical protein BH11PSE14_BH11PSE14_18160 [soil metagenome]
MSAPRDPAWIDKAVRVYGACLWLYPRAVRDAHGADMRQAFRDRCREVARGKRSAWQWFGTELAPDLVASATRAHLELGSPASDARIVPGLVLLALLALALATQSRWAGSVNDGIKAIGRYADIVQDARKFRHRAQFVRDLSATLATSGGAESLAVAALMHRAEFNQQYTWNRLAEQYQYIPLRQSEEGARASAMAAQVFTHEVSLAALSISTQACVMEAGCNQDMALRLLLARDPENAFNWMMEFKRAAQRNDIARMQAAMEGVRQARYAESHIGVVHRVLFGPVLADHAGDLNAMEDAAEQFRTMKAAATDDISNDLRVQCSLRVLPRPLANPRWVDTHPESRATCLHLAALLAASSDAHGAAWGWRQLRLAGAPLTPERTAAMRDAAWLARQWWNFGYHTAADHSWTPWTLQDWTRWNAAWAVGDGEIPAVKRWLRADGKPVHAPPDFQAWSPGS